MKKGKDIFILLFLIVSAMVIGGLVGELTAGIPALKWITYGQAFGFNSENTRPLIDLQMFQLTFGIRVQISILQIILVSAALLIYRKVR